MMQGGPDFGGQESIGTQHSTNGSHQPQFNSSASSNGVKKPSMSGLRV